MLTAERAEVAEKTAKPSFLGLNHDHLIFGISHYLSPHQMSHSSVVSAGSARSAVLIVVREQLQMMAETRTVAGVGFRVLRFRSSVRLKTRY